MARIAIEAGVDALAHTPFTELLDPGLIATAVGSGQRWISTLDIHRDDHDSDQIARTNLERFLSVGGVVLYGTDLGNGDRVPGIQLAELAALDAAGLRGNALVDALTDPWPGSGGTHAVSTFIPGAVPESLEQVVAWLAGAIVVPEEELVRDEH